MNIVIIEYGMGNVGSIKNMYKKIGMDCTITDNPELIKNATHIILPGVGSFDNGMNKLVRSPSYDILINKVANDKIPLLGICLGMQLLTNGSEEGKLPGLKLINASTRRFDFQNNFNGEKLKIPHMGWNEVKYNSNHPIFKGYTSVPKFYFVHSFHAVCTCSTNSIGTTTYGYEFSSSISNNNIIGVQFHPEKSHKYGLQLLKNFGELKSEDFS